MRIALDALVCNFEERAVFFPFFNLTAAKMSPRSRHFAKFFFFVDKKRFLSKLDARFHQSFVEKKKRTSLKE